jgi:uncharacterized protein involved in outer membrane biogenesis
MKRKIHIRWKWILGICVAVIIAAFVTAYMIVLSYDFNKFKPRITELAKQYTGRELTLGGDIDVKIGLFPTLVVNDVAFQNAAWGSQPQMAQTKRLEVQIALLPILAGDIHIRQLTAADPEFLIEIDKSGQWNLEFDDPLESEPKTPADPVALIRQYFPEFKDVQIEGGTFTFRDHRSGRSEEVAIEKLELESSRFGLPLDVDLKFSLNKTPFEISGELGRLSKMRNPDERWPVDLTIAAAGSEISIAGHITDVMTVTGIDLRLAAKGSDIANLQQLTGESIPVKGAFDITGHLTAATSENVKISDIAVVLGESTINGEMALDQTSPRPQVNARFHSSRLDLRPFIKQNTDGRQTEAKTKQKQTQDNRVFSVEPFDLQDFHRIDAAVRFDADEILTHRIALDKFQLDVSLKNGHLIIKTLTIDIGGGKLSGSLDLLAKGNHVNLATQMTVKKIDFGEMLKKLEITQDLDGVLDIDLDFKGQGKSMTALMAGLNGDLIAILSEGRMPVAYIDLLGADIADGFLSLLNPLEKKIDLATINCAICDFYVQDGLAKSDVIMIDDPEKSLLSRGTINLKTEALDFAIYTKPKKGIGTKETGRLSVNLSQITKPFKLGGTLANPSLGISPERALITAGRALLGPAGWASFFISASAGNEDPCAAALKIAGRGPTLKTEVPGKAEAQQSAGEKKKEGTGSKIKKFFRKQK